MPVMRLPATAVFDHPTPRAMARLIIDLLLPQEVETTEETDDPGGESTDTLDAGAEQDEIDEMDLDDLVDLALQSQGPTTPGGQEN